MGASLGREVRQLHATHLVRLFPKEAARLAEGVTDIRMNSVYIQFEELRPVGKPGYRAPKSYPCERCGDKVKQQGRPEA